MIDYKNIIKHLDSCVFICITPELAKEASTAIRFLMMQLNEAEQCIYAIEDALDRGNDNDWAREVIAKYENSKIK